MDIDLSALTLTQVFGLLALVAFIDLATAVVLSITRREFSGGYVADWISSHVLRRTFPIFALAVLGAGITPLGIPEIPPAFGLALVGLGTYIVETISSIQDSFQDTATPVSVD